MNNPEQPRTNVYVMIRYVNKIEVTEAKYLSSATVIKKAGVMIPDGVSFTGIDMVGLASLDISDKINNKERIFSSKLVAFLPERIEIADRKLCFRITTVQNETFLMGTGARPFPVVELSETVPDSVGSRCGCTMTVTYTSTIPVLSILL